MTPIWMSSRAREVVRKEREDRHPLSLCSARWADQEVSTFDRLMSIKDFSHTHVSTLREKACVAPERISANLQSILDNTEDLDLPEPPPNPSWIGKVLRQREVFEGTAFHFEVGGESQA